MSDLTDGLKEHVQLLHAWAKFELGMTPPDALDYQDTVEKLEQAAARIEALEAGGKRLAEAVEAVVARPVHSYADLRAAIAAWRAAEKGGG